MNSAMDENYIEINKIILRYLRNVTLPKVAYLTNCLPNNLERKYIIGNFNYMCFCAQNYLKKTEILFLLFMRRYKKIPFDVYVDIPEDCLIKRQFGYVCLKYENAAIVQEKLNFISSNKTEINLNYPILLRLISVNDKIETLNVPSNITVEKKLSNNDIMFIVK
jgi:hypothetical protein